MSGCGCGCGSDAVKGSGDAKLILEALANAVKPCGNKDLVEATGLDKAAVSKEIAALKKKGFVDSPVRCKYGITAEGKASL